MKFRVLQQNFAKIPRRQTRFECWDGFGKDRRVLIFDVKIVKIKFDFAKINADFGKTQMNSNSDRGFQNMKVADFKECNFYLCYPTYRDNECTTDDSICNHLYDV